MNLYLNKISRSEVHFGSISDYWADVLDLRSAHGKRSGELIPTLEMQLALLLDDEPNEEAVRFTRLYLEACEKYPDAEVTCE